MNPITPEQARQMAELVPKTKSSSAALAMEELRKLEDELYIKHLGIMDAVASWPDLSPSDQGPPEEWVLTMGPVLADKRFRVAQAAWLANKEAPVGLGLSQKFVQGYQKARARELGDDRPLHLQITQININPAQYPEKDIT